MTPLFSPQSMYWRINREWLIALAGPRAVLLELAHPAVAAGVAHHSNYRGDPFGRLYRTMKTMTEISFGTAQERQNALRHFHGCHARVKGFASAPEVPNSIAYSARDPHLQFWVLATLIDSVLLVYERFVMPLTFAEKCAYYQDCQKLAAVMGISPAVVPSNYAAFLGYMSEMLSSEILTVTPDARDVTDSLFALTLRGCSTRLFSFASIGMLPSSVRAAYGYVWDDRREKYLVRFARLIRRLRPWIPAILAIHPKAHSMERRIALYKATAP